MGKAQSHVTVLQYVQQEVEPWDGGQRRSQPEQTQRQEGSDKVVMNRTLLVMHPDKVGQKGPPGEQATLYSPFSLVLILSWS